MTTKIITTTKIGRAKFAAAHQSGILPKITHLVFGDGGHDASGDPIEVDDNATVVPGQFATKYPVASVTPDGMVCTIVGALDYSHEVGQIVSACGLMDSEGDLIAYKNFSPKSKDADSRFEILWTEQF